MTDLRLSTVLLVAISLTLHISMAREDAAPEEYCEEVEESTEPTTPSQGELCPDGWMLYSPEKTCIWWSGAENNFTDARADCQSHPGGDLVKIVDDTKNEFVKARVGRKFMWLGMINARHDGKIDMQYLDGTSLGSYNAFAPGQPDNTGQSEFCIVMYGTKVIKLTGMWNDLSCHKEIRYVCEMPKPN